MYYVIRYYLKPDQTAAFREWLEANRARLHEQVPKGWCYLGTSLSTSDYDCETRWQLDKLEELDTGTLSEFHALTEDLAAFIDPVLPVEGKFQNLEGVTGL